MPRKKTDLSQRLEAVIKTLVPQQEQNPDDLGPMMRAIKAVHSISAPRRSCLGGWSRQASASAMTA